MFEQKKKLKSLLIECASKVNTNETPPNEKMHNASCKAILKQAETFNVPIGIILYLGIGTNAHKAAVFERGYKQIPDHLKIQKVLNMSEIFAKKFKYPKLSCNAALVHFLSRYYDNGGKIGELRKYISSLPKDFDFSIISNAKGWANALLKDSENIKLSNKGYYNGKI